MVVSEFHRRIADQEVRIRQLEEDKVALGQKPTQDPEFIRSMYAQFICCQSLTHS